MKEKEMKQRLTEKMRKYFIVDEKPKGTIEFNGETKILKPDLLCRFKSNKDLFFLIEIKDDSTKSFKLTDLLRQCASYRFAFFPGALPNPWFIVIATTESLMRGESYSHKGEMHLANKLQIGVMRTKFNNKIQKKGLSIIIGSQNFWIDNGNNEFHFDYFNIPELCLGTKSNTNKKKNKIVRDMEDEITIDPNDVD